MTDKIRKEMRLIDAEHLKWNVGGIKCGTLTVDYLNWILEHEEPTVDAVPVIRCKDCKFHRDRTQCNKRIGAWFDDDYCNGAVRAERKEE